MKKFLSVVAVIALVFALAVPAFAAEDAVASVTGGTGITTKTEDVTVVDDELNPAQNEALEALVGSKEDKLFEVVDVTYTGADVTAANPLKVVFVRGDSNKVEKVLYWNDTDNKWDEAKFEQNGTEVTATFEHLCDVVFVVEKVENTVANPTTTTTQQTAAAKGGKSSPQTGYNVIAWSIAVSALVMAAGYCFVSARKVTE